MELNQQALWKRWKISETLLKRAHCALPRPAVKTEEQFRALEKALLEYLEHNEHELALDMLQEMGEVVAPRGGFWKDLVRAAENMRLLNHKPYLEKNFHQGRPPLQSK